MKQESLSEQINKACFYLRRHSVVAFPTETVMGLGVIFDDETAYLKLNNIKKRAPEKPYTLMVSGPEEITKYAVINDNVKKIITSFMPGPLTVLLPALKNLPTYVTHNSGVVGIRIPDDEVTSALLKKIGTPLLVPSANKAGEKPALNSDDVINIFHDEVDYVIKGKAKGEKPSTVLDLTKVKPLIVREGQISLKAINEVLNG